MTYKTTIKNPRPLKLRSSEVISLMEDAQRQFQICCDLKQQQREVEILLDASVNELSAKITEIEAKYKQASAICKKLHEYLDTVVISGVDRVTRDKKEMLIYDFSPVNN